MWTMTWLFLKVFQSFFSLLCSFHMKIFLHLVLDVMYVIKRPPRDTKIVLTSPNIAQYIAREFPFMVIRGDIGHIGVEIQSDIHLLD